MTAVERRNIFKYILIFIIFFIFVIISGCVSENSPSISDHIQFSGHNWSIKSSSVPVGPGPNYFSNSTKNVWTDENGRLHLKITKTNGTWNCAEIISSEKFGYGTYIFSVVTPPKQLDENAVLGLFTWDDAPEYAHREIDIELSRWGQSANDNAQFVVQPWDVFGNIYRFNVNGDDRSSYFSFKWSKDSIIFSSYYGDNFFSPVKGEPISLWNYTGKYIPFPGQENARINLWLINGNSPKKDDEIECIISRFQFIPD